MASAYAAKEAAARAYLDKRKADLADQVDSWITLIEFAMTGLKREITRGEASKGGALSRDDAGKMRDLGHAMESAAKVKIALAKAEKLLASQATPEEVLMGCEKKLMALPEYERAKVLVRMCKKHRDEGRATRGANFKTTTTNTALEMLSAMVATKADIDEPQVMAEDPDPDWATELEELEAAVDSAPR